MRWIEARGSGIPPKHEKIASTKPSCSRRAPLSADAANWEVPAGQHQLSAGPSQPANCPVHCLSPKLGLTSSKAACRPLDEERDHSPLRPSIAHRRPVCAAHHGVPSNRLRSEAAAHRTPGLHRRSPAPLQDLRQPEPEPDHAGVRHGRDPGRAAGQRARLRSPHRQGHLVRSEGASVAATRTGLMSIAGRTRRSPRRSRMAARTSRCCRPPSCPARPWSCRHEPSGRSAPMGRAPA